MLECLGDVPGLTVYSYDQGVMGGLLTLDSFSEEFPQIDVRGLAIGDPGYIDRSTIQGTAVSLADFRPS